MMLVQPGIFGKLLLRPLLHFSDVFHQCRLRDARRSTHDEPFSGNGITHVHPAFQVDIHCKYFTPDIDRVSVSEHTCLAVAHLQIKCLIKIDSCYFIRNYLKISDFWH
jgi:hypothetical protein